MQENKKLRSLVFWCLCGVVSIGFLIWLSCELTASHIESQFKVIYSLDKRQNDQEIIRLINEADKYVYFAIYYFSKNNIADALIRAKNRGLVVQGIVDREGSESASKSIVEKLKSSGIQIEVQKHLDGIMHIKSVVTDKAYASGSYNWTEAATDSNDEILEIGVNDGLRREYLNIIKKVLSVNL